MLLKPRRQRYQWIYDPSHQSLVMLPRTDDIDIYAKNLLNRVLKSLELADWLKYLKGELSPLEAFECIADSHEFSIIMAKLKPKLVLYCGELQMSAPNLLSLPHPNTWHTNFTLKKRIWLSWHALKYKAG